MKYFIISQYRRQVRGYDRTCFRAARQGSPSRTGRFGIHGANAILTACEVQTGIGAARFAGGTIIELGHASMGGGIAIARSLARNEGIALDTAGASYIGHGRARHAYLAAAPQPEQSIARTGRRVTRIAQSAWLLAFALATAKVSPTYHGVPTAFALSRALFTECWISERRLMANQIRSTAIVGKFALTSDADRRGAGTTRAQPITKPARTL